MKDLAILLADNDIQRTIESLLKRSRDLGIRPLDYDIFRHPNRDSGCYKMAHEYMRSQLKTHQFLLVMFDYHGCGADHLKSPEEVEATVEESLSRCGWLDRCGVIVPDPELEIWVWSNSPQLPVELGWSRKDISVNEWLINKGFLRPHEIKPMHPKEAMRAILREARKPPSPAIFEALAEKVAFGNCTDRAFIKFKKTLHCWFSHQ
jgi:hypothetical protein